MIPVILGLGSNNNFNDLQSLEILSEACRKLQNFFENQFAKTDAKNQKIKLSSIYITRAMYVTDQNDFYNAAVLGYVSNDYSPFDLLKEIQKIEALLGRDRSKEIRFGPRTLDIDIELFGNQKISTKKLEIPHPRLHERSFILTPMLEIFPRNADCFKAEVFENYLENLPDQGVRLFMNSDEFWKKTFDFSEMKNGHE